MVKAAKEVAEEGQQLLLDSVYTDCQGFFLVNDFIMVVPQWYACT